MANPLPEELKDELRQTIEALLTAPTFRPVDLSEYPEGAPEGTNYFDMYVMGLDVMVQAQAERIDNMGLDPFHNAQDTLNGLAMCGFTIDELGGLLAVAIGRLLTKTNDSVTQGS